MFIKKFAILAGLCALLSSSTYAITYEVIGPCSETPRFEGSFDVTNLKTSVGKTSLTIFENQSIPYQGTDSGFNSILNTPVGLDSIEVISDTSMRAYGWCYSVNGAVPDALASEINFSSNSDKLVWFYAYSTYESGKWPDYCVPSYKIKASQFCAK